MRLPPAVLVCGAWVVAVAAATVLVPGHPALGAAALALAAPAAAAAIGIRPRWIALAAAAACLGVARAELVGAPPDLQPVAQRVAGSAVRIDGRVADDPRDISAGYELLLAPVAAVRVGGGRLPAFGDVLVTAKGPRRVAFGDIVEVDGKLILPPESAGFDRRAYLAASGAWLQMRVQSVNVLRSAPGPWQITGAIRDLYKLGIARMLPPPHAQVLDGVVLGIRQGIPAPLNQALIATGLVHLLVLSGLKVAVFARLLTAALRGLLGHAATWPAIALVGLYAAVGGGTPAAVRAAALGGLVLLGGRLGRPTHVWTSLAATAAAMTVWEPDLAWNVGFQLSFLGTAAIILLTPPIERRLGWLPGAFREPLAVTCAAQVGTAPLMAADFHVISPVAPIANALVLPLLPALIAIGLLLAPLALVPFLGAILATPAVALLAYLEQVAELLSRLPGAAIDVGGLPPGAGLAYYLALGGAVLAAGGTALGRHRRAGVAVGLLGPLIVTGTEVAGWSWPRSEAAVLNVGAGSALLLRGSGGFVLVDGGPSPPRLEDALGGRLAPWQRDLAGLVITADSIGRVGGLAGLDRNAGSVLVPAGGLPGTAWRRAVLAEMTTGARVIRARAGEDYELAGLDFQVLSPEATEPGDEQGWGDLALRITRPSGRALCDFSDLGADAQRLAARRLRGHCDYLVFDSRAAPDPDLVAALDPSQLVLSAAAGTRAPPGLPAGLLRRTDEEGDIVLAL